MNLKQLTRDLEKQGYTCELSENGDYLCVYYLCYLDYVEISSIYKLGSNKVAQKPSDRCIKIAQRLLGYHILYLHGN